MEHWYYEVVVNNLNSRVYVKMLEDMRKMGDGVFTCTLKINEGVICDYLTIESEAYVESRTTEANQVD